ncbi:MAG: hypothetical protein WD069_03710 [Planctomycetales bacterium]
MSDLDNLNSVFGQPLSEAQIRGILAQIDLDIVNLLRDGKLSALKYAVGGAAGHATDRASNLKALLACRAHYERQLESLPAWETASGECGNSP